MTEKMIRDLFKVLPTINQCTLLGYSVYAKYNLGILKEITVHAKARRVKKETWV